MIYEYLEQAKNDLKWLLTSPSVITNDISTLSTLKINSLIEDLTSCDDSYLKKFYSDMFKTFDFEKSEAASAPKFITANGEKVLIPVAVMELFETAPEFSAVQLPLR